MACRELDTVVYPSAVVKQVLSDHLVPVRINVLQDREAAKRHRAFWTPTMLFSDAEGAEYHRLMGYYPPEEFAAQLLLGVGLSRLQKSETDRAMTTFEEIGARFGTSHAAPVALYWKGVCGTRKVKNSGPIYEACKEVVARYPGSEMAMKIGFVTKYKDFNIKP